jgi:hypothetical protein
MEPNMQGLSASPARRAIALAALLVLTARPASAGDLRIDDLQIRAESALYLTVPSFSSTEPEVLASARDSQVNAAGLLAPPVVTALTADRWGLSLATASQANTGYFRDHVLVVNDYPVRGPFGSTLPLTVQQASAASAMDLTVSALSPDAPLDMTLHVFGGQLRGTYYYGLGGVTIRVHLTLATKDALGHDDVPWEWVSELDMFDYSGPKAQVASNSLIHDIYGIGEPLTHFEMRGQDFASTAKVTIDDFVAHLDFGRLQPGENFQISYSARVDIQGTWEYPGPRAGAEADLVDPLSLGGRAARAPIEIAGLAFPSAVPEPGVAALWLAGLGWVLARRRRIATGIIGPETQGGNAAAAAAG